MKSSTFLSLYEKLEHFVLRLPAALQQPILREITPIKTLFLLQRPPRFVLLGSSGSGKRQFIDALFGSEVLLPGEENLSDGTWQEIGRSGRGSIKLLDARRPASINMLRAALAAEPADLFILVGGDTRVEESHSADLDQAQQIIKLAESQHEDRPRLLGVLASDGDTDQDVEAARLRLHSSLHSRSILSDRVIGTLPLATPEQVQRLAELIAIQLPGAAQLEMARLSGNRALQAQIASVVIKSVTAICTAIGAQPIPLADLPILTSLQASMVAGIMHISGHEWSPKLAAKFVTALGANIGAGLVLREGARAAARLVPFWGNAVSGAIAGAGTYAIGRAATAYFIEGMSLPDARQIFRRRRIAWRRSRRQPARSRRRTGSPA